MMQILHWVLKMIVDPLCQWHSSQQCPISSPNSLSTAQSSPNHTGFPEKVIDIKLISNGQPSYPHIALVHTYSWNPCSRWNFLHKLSVEASQQPSHPRLQRLQDSWYKLYMLDLLKFISAAQISSPSLTRHLTIWHERNILSENLLLGRFKSRLDIDLLEIGHQIPLGIVVIDTEKSRIDIDRWAKDH